MGRAGGSDDPPTHTIEDCLQFSLLLYSPAWMAEGPRTSGEHLPLRPGPTLCPSFIRWLPRRARIGLETVPPGPELQEAGRVQEGILRQAKATEDDMSSDRHLLAWGRRQRQDLGAGVHGGASPHAAMSSGGRGDFHNYPGASVSPSKEPRTYGLGSGVEPAAAVGRHTDTSTHAPFIS